ncbi:DUF3800 domain-containing protein [Sinorhizobium fredii]|uniref:DUF3800 domain-containing protein n=1 Tax=Rhizobium fredii TaxID=380 RepID=UPI0009B6DCF4|nr:DUF3800 domain-containing protein [Sinorhizobium fredii]
MYLCFVDESGTPPSRPNPNHPYFTLGAVIIEDNVWHDIADHVRGFCTRHRLRGELKWRYFSPHNRSPENPMAEKNPEERKALSLEFADIIAHSPLTIIACVTDIEVAFQYASVTNQRELYHFAYKPLSERFQYFLQDQKSLGIVIADHRGRDDDRLFRAHHDSLVGRSGKTVSAYGRFVEGLLLQDSCHSIGIQLADFVAGAIHRAYSTADKDLATVMKSRIRAKKDGTVLGHGVVHHPRDRFRSDLQRK